MGFKKPFKKEEKKQQVQSLMDYKQRKDFFGKKPSVLPALKGRKRRIEKRFK